LCCIDVGDQDRAMAEHDARSWALVWATVVLWATAFPAIRVALESFDAASLGFLRTATAAVALLAGARVGRGAGIRCRAPGREHLGLAVLCAASGAAAYQYLLNEGERTVTAGTASLIVATAPVYSMLIAARVLGEHMTSRRWVGLGVAFVGAAVVAVSGPGGVALQTGALVVLVAAVVQGVYHVAQRPLLRTRSAYEVATYTMVGGALMLAPAAPGAIEQLGRASASAIVAFVFLGLGPSAIGFVTWAAAVQRLEVGRPALALYAVPVVAIAVAWLWLGERPTVVAVLGGLVALAGVALGSRRPNR